MQKSKYLCFWVFSLRFNVFLSSEMMNAAGAVNAVLPHLLTPSEVLNEFQNSENGFSIDAICTLLLFAAKSFVISLKFQENILVFSLFFLPSPLACWTVAHSAPWAVWPGKVERKSLFCRRHKFLPTGWKFAAVCPEVAQYPTIWAALFPGCRVASCQAELAQTVLENQASTGLCHSPSWETELNGGTCTPPWVCVAKLLFGSWVNVCSAEPQPCKPGEARLAPCSTAGRKVVVVVLASWSVFWSLAG